MLDLVPVSPENWRVPLSVSPDQAREFDSLNDTKVL